MKGLWKSVVKPLYVLDFLIRVYLEVCLSKGLQLMSYLNEFVQRTKKSKGLTIMGVKRLSIFDFE